MLSDFVPRFIRKLLFPFSFVYWLVIAIRNWLFDKNILKSSSVALPIIGIGNLAVGGTGKSPMTEYIVRLLKDEYRVATLSRGYKRRTKGYALANEQSTALDIGDEPMQFHVKFPEISVAVGENRLEAIAQLLQDKPDTEVIVMDDVLQHRQLNAGLNILLTEFSNLYTRDLLLPAGELRDQRSSANRADIIVVTKCPSDLTKEKSESITKEINPTTEQNVFFATFEYGQLKHLFHQTPGEFSQDAEVIILSGIANPAPIKKMIHGKVKKVHFIRFADHHIFNQDDVKEINKMLTSIKNPHRMILTTEKDAVRLVKFGDHIMDWPIFVLPVQHAFLFDGEAAFNNSIKNFIREFEPVQKS